MADFSKNWQEREQELQKLNAARVQVLEVRLQSSVVPASALTKPLLAW